MLSSLSFFTYMSASPRDLSPLTLIKEVLASSFSLFYCLHIQLPDVILLICSCNYSLPPHLEHNLDKGRDLFCPTSSWQCGWCHSHSWWTATCSVLRGSWGPALGSTASRPCPPSGNHRILHGNFDCTYLLLYALTLQFNPLTRLFFHYRTRHPCCLFHKVSNKNLAT